MDERDLKLIEEKIQVDEANESEDWDGNKIKVDRR